jgi:hypothetical protein
MDSYIVKLLQDKMTLDCELQHLKKFHEGYRECMLVQIHGYEYVEDELEIDTIRYSPDSPRRISYDEGWNSALNDFSKIKQV